MDNVRLVLIGGERENSFHGRELLTVGILRGKVEDRWLRGHSEGLQGAGQVILVAIVGVEGSVEGVRIVNGEWLAETFNRYSIEPPKKLSLKS